MPDFKHQPPLRREMRCRYRQDAAHEIQAISAAVQRQHRLLAIFRRQCPHHRLAYVGWIAQDQVVTSAGETGEQIGADQLQALRQLVFAHIAPCHGKRRTGDVDAIDLCTREGVRGNDGKAAGAGAQIQDCLRRLTWFQPRLQTRLQQFGDVRARHDDTFIDIEAVFAEPGFVSQVSGGNTFADAAREQLLRASRDVCGQRLVESCGEVFKRTTQRMHHQPGGFIIGVERAVAVGEAGAAKMSGSFGDQLSRGVWPCGGC